MNRQLGLFLSGTAAWWALMAIAGRSLEVLGGERAPAYAAVAALLCGAPTCLTLWWSQLGSLSDASRQLLLVFGGTTFRMTAALAGGAAAYVLIPYFQQPAFWINILALYLFTLAWEIALLLRASNSQGLAIK